MKEKANTANAKMKPLITSKYQTSWFANANWTCEVIPKPVKWPNLFVELEAPTLGPYRLDWAPSWVLPAGWNNFGQVDSCTSNSSKLGSHTHIMLVLRQYYCCRYTHLPFSNILTPFTSRRNFSYGYQTRIEWSTGQICGSWRILLFVEPKKYILVCKPLAVHLWTPP